MSRDESRRSKRARADRDYELGPSAGILTNDYDDERTLDEEEALEGSEDTHNELSHLQKESDMPLKDLLVMYGYGDMSCQDPNKDEDEDEDEEEEEEEDEDDEDEEDDDPTSYEPDLKQFYTEMVKGEKNGANVKRLSTSEGGDPAKSSESAAVVSNVNTNSTTDNAEQKSGENAGVAESNLVDGLNPERGTADVPDNATSSSGAAASSGNVGSGGGGGSSRLLRSVSRPQSEEEEDDCDYSPDEEEWKKTIMVGSDYQAAIPEGLCKYDDALPYENEDKMLWDPCHMGEDEVEEFLERAQLPVGKGTTLPNGSHVRDDEQALYLLLQCGYNLEEALRRRRMNALPSTESVSLWSEEECHNFETGLRNYGKDFHLIQKNKVRTRSVGELVQFYYLWKKTERHDIFTYKARLEKKKYALHPGITDYMDRFLEEQEGVRDRSSSPNIHCLLYGDTKRQRTHANSTSNEEPSTKANIDMLDASLATTTTTTTTTTATSLTTAGATTTTTTNTTSDGGSTTTTSVNSGLADPLALDHHQHHHRNITSSTTSISTPLSSSSAITTAATATDYTKTNNTESTTTTTTITTSTQQRNHNNHHNTQANNANTVNNSGSNVSNNNQEERITTGAAAAAAAVATRRSPENILPHLPP